MKRSSDLGTYRAPRVGPCTLAALARLVPVAMVLLLLACVSAGPPAEAAEPSSGLVVTVMVYSGRPDPSFTIDDPAAIAELRDALQSAPAKEGFDRQTVVPSILGYNGVLIENPAGVEGVPAVLMLYGGTIEARNGGKRFLDDPGRQLERRLIDQATEHGVLDEATLGVIRKALGGTNPAT